MQKLISGLLVWALLPSNLHAQLGGAAGSGGKSGFAASGTPSASIWTLVQHPNNFTCSTTGTGSTQTLACTVTLTQNTTAGNALVMLTGSYATATVAPTFSSASGDSSWTHCPAEYVTNNYSGPNFETVDCAYLVNATGGAGTVTYTWTATINNGQTWLVSVELLEVHRSSGTAAFDACTSGGGCISTALGTSNRVSPGGCQISGTNDMVMQWIADSEVITGIGGAAYNSPLDLDESNVASAYSGALNQAAAPSQLWITPSEQSQDGAAMACFALK